MTVPASPRVSSLSRSLTASGILRIAGEVREMVSAGEPVCNLTVGDFAPSEFRIPELLSDSIADAVRAGETNYPPQPGVPALREAVRQWYAAELGLDYQIGSIIVASGARPVIYSAYRALVDPGDRVVFPVPSWNNEYYCTITGAVPVPILCSRDTGFLPSADSLREAARGARLLVLNSPVNPTGTAFKESTLADICDVVLEENARRAGRERPLYLLYDQVYWTLTFHEVRHVEPVGVRPEMREYTIFADAASKCFAATGIRVGWAVGPADVIGHMCDIISHAGGWAPRAEQVAVAKLIQNRDETRRAIADLKSAVETRLDAMYDGCMSLKAEGHPVDAIRARGAIYLSAQFALHGRRTDDGRLLETDEDVRRYLLRRAGAAVIPFQIFGCPDGSGWCRLSAGAVSREQIDSMFPRIRAAIEALEPAESLIAHRY